MLKKFKKHSCRIWQVIVRALERIGIVLCLLKYFSKVLCFHNASFLASDMCDIGAVRIAHTNCLLTLPCTLRAINFQLPLCLCSHM
uniref:Putative ovule protein n=1 Tax=Solanum chacoense TaxID=4108 RepID=A0A0V0IQ33_SOLCH